MAPRAPEPPSSAALKQVARAELRSLAAALRRAGPGESVHGARRQIKRLRSLLRLLRAPLGEEAYARGNAALRDAANSLAGQRRAEALVLAAGRLTGGREARLFWLHVAEVNREAHAASEQAAGPGHGPALQSVAKAAKALAQLRIAEGGGAAALDAAFLSHYRKARKRLRQGVRSEDAEALHEARKFVIHHLHHLDLLRGLVIGTGKRITALEKLREALGDLNDLDELRALASALEKDPPAPAARAMAKRRSRLLARTKRFADRLFRRKAKAFRKRIGPMWLAREG